MNSELSRRKFIKAGILGAGTILTWTVLSDTALAVGTGVRFSTKKGRKGCRQCEKAISKMLKDKKMKAELEKLFPKKSRVVFYVKSQRASMKVAKNAIVVGGCARAIKSKADVFVKGCHKEIKPDYIYKTIIEALGKEKDEK